MHDHSIYRRFCESARRYPQRVCLKAETSQLTYAQVHAQVTRLAAFLQHGHKVLPGTAVIVIADQSEWWLVVSLAIQAIGAAEFPVEASKSRSEIEGLIKKTGCVEMVILDNAAASRLASLAAKQTGLRLVLGPGVDLHADPERVKLLTSLLQADPAAPVSFTEHVFPVAAVIATSGTTGEPKLVPVAQHSFMHAMRVVARVLKLKRSDVFLSCLPSWHLYARLVEYVAIGTGGSIVYSSIAALPDTLRNSGCTVFPSFPEIWEKIYRQILFAIEQSKMRIFLRYAIRFVIATDRIYEYWFGRARYEKKTAAFTAIIKLAYLLPLRYILQRTVFRAMRRGVSPNLRYAIMGDAPLPLVVDETLRAIGFEVLEGYGSTEQCVTALRRPTRNFPGSVGKVLPGVHVTIEDSLAAEWNGTRLGEIVVSGPNVFAGYFKDMPSLGKGPGTNASHRTGDMGSLDAHGNLIVVGRGANTFRLASGEVVFPELVENVLRGSRFVGRVLVFGNGSPKPIALVVPDFHELLQWLAEHAYAPALYEYAEKPEVHAAFWQPLLAGVANDLYAREFEALISESGLPLYARPGRFHLLPRRFHRGAELTLTLKPRREFIRRQFAELL